MHFGAQAPTPAYSKTYPGSQPGASSAGVDVAALAKQFLHAIHGLGRNDEKVYEIMGVVGEKQLRNEFNAEIRRLKPDAYTALDLIHREYQGNPLEKVFLKAPYKRAENLYWEGKDRYAASDMHYRLEGIAAIPMELFKALTQHPVPTASIFATIAILASFVPFGAAKLSNVITLISLGGMVQNEWKAAHAPKGSERRANALRHAGENWIGIGINTLPMPEVVHHLEGGVNAIKTGYQGLKTEIHAASASEGVAKTVTPFVKKAAEYGKELAQSLPGFAKVNGQMAAGSVHYLAQFPQKVMQNGGKEFENLGRAFKSGIGYDSNFPEIYTRLKNAKNPKEVIATVKQALTSQVWLALTLIDEIMFPFVKILQSFKGGETPYPDK